MYKIIGKVDKINVDTLERTVILLLEHDNGDRVQYVWLREPGVAGSKDAEQSGYNRLEEALMVMRFEMNDSKYTGRMILFY